MRKMHYQWPSGTGHYTACNRATWEAKVIHTTYARNDVTCKQCLAMLDKVHDGHSLLQPRLSAI